MTFDLGKEIVRETAKMRAKQVANDQPAAAQETETARPVLVGTTPITAPVSAAAPIMAVRHVFPAGSMTTDLLTRIETVLDEWACSPWDWDLYHNITREQVLALLHDVLLARKESSAGDATTQEPVDHAPHTAGPDAQPTSGWQAQEQRIDELELALAAEQQRIDDLKSGVIEANKRWLDERKAREEAEHDAKLWAVNWRANWRALKDEFTQAAEAALAGAVRAERERCAKVCDQMQHDCSEAPETARYCAEAIRALSPTLEARPASIPVAILANALQDTIHTETGPVRNARASRPVQEAKHFGDVTGTYADNTGRYTSSSAPVGQSEDIPAAPSMGMWDDFCAVFPVPFDKFQLAYAAMVAGKQEREHD